jgi:hypothetical protein
MGIHVYFGNMSIREWQKEMGIELNHKDFEWLEEHRQESAQSIAKDMFHIFNEPLQIHVGNEIADELVARLLKYDYSNANRSCVVVEVKK